MKRWINPIVIELFGVSIFALGVAFYFLYVENIIHYSLERSIHAGESFSADIIEKYIFYWNFSAIIMLIGGLFIYLGILVLGVKILSVINSNKLTETKRVFSSAPLITISLAIPVVFNYLYRHVNENIIVKQFGCGCPQMDDRFISFNANIFNMIVWGIMLFISLFLWLKGLLQINNKQVRYWIAIIGMSCLLVLILRFFALSCWM